MYLQEVSKYCDVVVRANGDQVSISNIGAFRDSPKVDVLNLLPCKTYTGYVFGQTSSTTPEYRLM